MPDLFFCVTFPANQQAVEKRSEEGQIRGASYRPPR